MGLDMFFCDDSGNEIQYFRKHSDLHGWLQDEWLKTQPKDTDPDEFNCTDFPITQEILDGMKELCEQDEHEHYSGFFWGESKDSDWEETKELCKNIQNRLDNGESVIYRSWW